MNQRVLLLLLVSLASPAVASQAQQQKQLQQVGWGQRFFGFVSYFNVFRYLRRTPVQKRDSRSQEIQVAVDNGEETVEFLLARYTKLKGEIDAKMSQGKELRTSDPLLYNEVLEEILIMQASLKNLAKQIGNARKQCRATTSLINANIATKNLQIHHDQTGSIAEELQTEAAEVMDDLREISEYTENVNNALNGKITSVDAEALAALQRAMGEEDEALVKPRKVLPPKKKSAPKRRGESENEDDDDEETVPALAPVVKKRGIKRGRDVTSEGAVLKAEAVVDDMKEEEHEVAEPALKKQKTQN